MLKNYSAIDLRGIKNDLYEYVVGVGNEDADFKGAFIRPDRLGKIKEMISKERPDIIFGVGEDLESNRKLIENQQVDVLSKPYPIDDTLAKIAGRNDTFFEICAREIISSRGYVRSRLIQSLSRTVSLAKKRDVRLVITSGARQPMELVTPRELVAFGALVGMEYPEAKAAIGTMPRYLLERRGLL